MNRITHSNIFNSASTKPRRLDTHIPILTQVSQATGSLVLSRVDRRPLGCCRRLRRTAPGRPTHQVGTGMATPAREVRATGVAFLKRATSARFRRRMRIRLPRATPALLKAPRGRLLSSAPNGTEVRLYILGEEEVDGVAEGEVVRE